MPKPLRDRRVALGVTGSIAAYKALDLASALVQAGAAVDVMMTTAAQKFVTPQSFAAIVHRPVAVDLFEPQTEMAMDHVALAKRAQVVVVAPATASSIARLACGLADDPVAATVLATTAPVLLAPAMDGAMFDSGAVQSNLKLLESRGFDIVGPQEGRLASGMVGKGRMSEPAHILEHVRALLGRLKGDLAGRRVLVTAGGTSEPIDPVRVITNRSSGRMGRALAEAARDRGAQVTLVTAAQEETSPAGIDVVPATTAALMGQAVRECAGSSDVLIMAAAVSDWQPEAISESKLRKGNDDRLTLNLRPTEDIVAAVDAQGLLKVGFALETENPEQNALAKLRAKGLDLVVANLVGEEGVGMGAHDNRVTLYDRFGNVEELQRMPKYDVAWGILDRVVDMLADSDKSA